jgi:hypothetical protein
MGKWKTGDYLRWPNSNRPSDFIRVVSVDEWRYEYIDSTRNQRAFVTDSARYTNSLKSCALEFSLLGMW